MPGPLLRAATVDDAVSIAALYAPYVLGSTATFELEPPSAAEIAQRIAAVQQLGLPYLAAEQEGRLVGYAYATQFRPRPAYRFTVEDSVYVAPTHFGRGIGRQLLVALIEACRAAGSRQMIAAVAGENPASIAMHAAQGFQPAGTLRDVGFKFDRWLDVTLMQLAL